EKSNPMAIQNSLANNQTRQSDKAPDWWRYLQAHWKARKESKKENYFMLLINLWVKCGDSKSQIILDILKLSEFDVIKTGKHNATMPIKVKGRVLLEWGTRNFSGKLLLFSQHCNQSAQRR
ncbi:hypothetical protein VP01_3317g1, partial [Puccinia sorghi]